MYRMLIFSICLFLFPVAIVVGENGGPTGPDVANGSSGPNAANGSGGPEAKTLRGMAVLGNNEAPMSLFIVPWKSSELGVEANLKRTLNERDVPVDRDVFMRELDYYQVSVGGESAASGAGS